MDHRNIDWEKLKIDSEKHFRLKHYLLLIYWRYFKNCNYEFFLDMIHEGKTVIEAYEIVKSESTYKKIDWKRLGFTLIFATIILILLYCVGIKIRIIPTYLGVITGNFLAWKFFK